MDDYSGTGVSISRDNGRTWSSPFDAKNVLYDFGRHHAWLVRMPNGDIVMTYLVRRGYRDSSDGFPRFGIEAVVSHDHGESWDLDHRYVLHVYQGSVPAKEYMAFQGAPSNASTTVLPDGSLLTAFNMEYTKIGLVNWKLNDQRLNDSKAVATAPFDSNLRNHFDPSVLAGDKTAAQQGPRNIAAFGTGVKITASPSDINPLLLLEDPYLYSQFPPGVVFAASPAWVEVSWPVPHRIEEVQILTGDPACRAESSYTWVPLDYRIECRKAGAWTELVPAVQHATGTIAYTWHAGGSAAATSGDSQNPVNMHRYSHKCSPVVTDAVRLTVTRSADAEKQRTFLKRISIIGE
jgi:hypothetical protein